MPPDVGYIYAIKAEGTPYVKIGRTTSTVEARLKALQTSQPHKLTVLAAIHIEEGLAGKERAIHKALAAHRSQGEWFTLTMTASEFLALVSAVSVLPRPVERARVPRTRSALGQNIVAARIAKGMRQYELCEAVGISKQHMSAIENGKTDPAFTIMQRIAKALGVPLDALAGDVEEVHSAA